jgi:hypothetical protein
MRIRAGRRALLATLTLSAGGFAGVTYADPIAPPGLTIKNGSLTLTPDETRANADGSFTYSGTDTGGTFGNGPSWGVNWSLTVNEDPFIIGALTITNFTNAPKDFNFSFLLPVLPAFSPSRMGGSVFASLLDANGDGAASLGPNASSPAIYRGQIDGGTVLPLFGALVSCNSGGGCVTTGSDSSGLPGLTLAGPGVAQDIRTLLSFTLSAGDSVTFNTNFTVEPVPLPAALPLLLLGFGTLGAGRLTGRRRSAARPALFSR